MARFGDAALRRYSRQILLREVGGRGQERILHGQVALIAGEGGGSIASVAAQYLLRAGVAQVHWFAATENAASWLRALDELEDASTLTQKPTLGLAPAINSRDGVLSEAPWTERPDFAQTYPRSLLCLAGWLPTTNTRCWWVTEDGCGSDIDGPSPLAVAAKSGLVDERLDARALAFGSALALGLLQDLLGCAPPPGAYFELAQH